MFCTYDTLQRKFQRRFKLLALFPDENFFFTQTLYSIEDRKRYYVRTGAVGLVDINNGEALAVAAAASELLLLPLLATLLLEQRNM
jgi:hypothetical protein